jgi:tetratricopeptide (TPR) repeat protein
MHTLRARTLVVAALIVIPLVPSASAAQTPADAGIQREQHKLRRNSRDAGTYHRLGDAYIQKSRETGDPSYLTLAETALRKALEIDPAHAGATRHLAYVFSSRHQFSGAAAQALAAITLDPADGDSHGVLGDAYLELGRYASAAEAYATMMRCKSDLASYSRMSGLKNLRGDARGAIEDLRLAIASGESSAQPRESLAWARGQLGAEHFALGEIDAALVHYEAALRTYPGYHRALAGLAQVRAARGQRAEAVELYTKALAVTPLPEYAVALGDLYTAMGRADEARKPYDLVRYIGRLNALNKVLYNRELAYFYADHDLEPATAVDLATRELETRRDIYAHDLLAWALHKAGRSAEAVAPMEEALRLGTLDAKLFFHAGMIHRALGDRARARDHLARALALNPHFHVLHARTAREALAALGEPSASATAGVELR